MEKVRRRDPAALGEFYDFFIQPLYGLALRLTGEESAAEDVVQEVFLKVYRSAETLDPERQPGPWLVTITYNVFRDQWRSGESRRERSSTSIDQVPRLRNVLVGKSATPEQSAIAGEREALVQRAITELPEELRATIVLHDYLGLGHAEIARITEVTYAASRKRYSRALHKLADLLRNVLG